MDAYNNASFYNYNTIIYGHNMRDGSMFARLKELSNEATLRQCPYFWILTPDADYLYKICSIHQASSGSDTFTVRFADYLKAEDVKFTVNVLMTVVTSLYLPCGRTTLLSVFHIRLFA